MLHNYEIFREYFFPGGREGVHNQAFSYIVDRTDQGSVANYKPLYLMAANLKTDVFQSPDYFQVDDLLTEEQKLIR